MFSDIHRGINNWADDFAPNQMLLFYALKHYFDNDFIYIEVGDGDELWENTQFSEIQQAHSHIFWIMKNLYDKQRLYLIYGNHDIARKNQKVVDDTLQYYFDEKTGKIQELFVGVSVHEGIILRNTKNNRRIFLLHGHQADPLNDRYWKLGKFLSRYLWRYIQLLGVKNPTSPARNFKKRFQIEKRLTNWVIAHHQMLISGHTHRPRFPEPGNPRYFNLGSCIHPRSITGIEIVNGELSLIKWWITSQEGGALYVNRQELVPFTPMERYFSRK